MVERMAIPLSIILGSIVIGFIIVFTQPPLPRKPLPPTISEYALSLARFHEQASFGMDLATLTALTVDAAARYRIVRPFVPKDERNKCGHGTEIARKSVIIARDISSEGVTLPLEARLAEIGVRVPHDEFKKVATSHLETFGIQMEARAHGNYDVVRNLDVIENQLRQSLINDVVAAADRAIADELRSCTILGTSD